MTKHLAALNTVSTCIVFSDVFKHDTNSLLAELDQFEESVSSSGINSQNSMNLLTVISKHMRDYDTLEKLFGMVQGYVFSRLSRVLTADEFRLACETKLGVGRSAALRYALIFDAWFSGRMTYTLPENRSPADLGVKDLALGAELISMGRLDEAAVDVLFGDGANASKRRALLGDGMLRVEREEDKDTGSDDDLGVISPPGVFIRGSGDLVYRDVNGIEYRIGVLFLDDPDPIVNSVCQRLRDALYVAISGMEDSYGK